MNIRPNWELKQCCNHEQFVFLVTVSVCAAVILPSLWGTAQIWIILVSNLTPFIDLLWRTILLKPFKLVTVFLHEASHAIACKLTCGKVLIYISMQVEGSQVHADEGGTTQTRGGIFVHLSGDAADSCFHNSSYCKNCCRMSCRCSASCTLGC
ncbi:hypothetical protein WN944_014164 [Citrus x changshan-huyou]|uniref:Uncharacterized protein n=1 Tax=Citrus x changshan-huyou TaxID=2935761 RepID=A0AAP0M6K5_9ROSI